MFSLFGETIGKFLFNFEVRCGVECMWWGCSKGVGKILERSRKNELRRRKGNNNVKEFV